MQFLFSSRPNGFESKIPTNDFQFSTRRENDIMTGINGTGIKNLNAAPERLFIFYFYFISILFFLPFHFLVRFCCMVRETSWVQFSVFNTIKAKKTYYYDNLLNWINGRPPNGFYWQSRKQLMVKFYVVAVHFVGRYSLSFSFILFCLAFYSNTHLFHFYWLTLAMVNALHRDLLKKS